MQEPRPNLPASFGRRALFRRAATVFATALLASTLWFEAPSARAHDFDRSDHDSRPDWVGTWSASPSNLYSAGYDDQTLRLIVHSSIGGEWVRVRLSNAFNTTSLRVGEVRVALQSQQAGIDPATDRPVRFSGNASVTIPPGAVVLSDPVELTLPPLRNLAVSLYLPGATGPVTEHSLGMQTNYASTPGNYTAAGVLPVAATRTSWSVLAGVEVTSRRAAAVVTFGDSITDGYGSTVDANRRWPNFLAQRLQAHHMDVAVLDEGISGNRVLHDGLVAEFGPNALSRLDRDEFGQSGVKWMVLLEGINDFGHAAPGTPDAVSAADIIAGYRQIIRRAHAQNIKVYGGTLTPYEGTIFEGYYQPAGEAKRQAVNAWIRSSGEFDAVIDFEAVVRDPAHPTRMLPAYDVGDHLHPNDAGYKAMADAIDLRLFRDTDWR